MTNIFISICIPAYKRIEFLKRLLESIVIQRYRDFEVIVCDDSPSTDVSDLCNEYKDKFALHYHKNNLPLGTPENWNEAIRQAKGQWIKLMHDDDWFSSPDSLQRFATAALQHKASFIFSSYTNMYFPGRKTQPVVPSYFRIRQLRKNSINLLSNNIIGPPSVVLHRNDGVIFYDSQIKWLVDIDFYNRRLEKEDFFHLNEFLVHVGISEEQVTASCHTNPQVEIPENFYFLQKTGTIHLRSILVYDAWWRLIRNLQIKNQEHLERYGTVNWPAIILRIVKDVNKIPVKLIKIGIISKLFMTFSYMRNRKRIK
jgi:glycosyltransferase involved in cell wall biosynthesis